MREQERAEFLGQIIDIFEDFLESKGIDLDNPEKAQSEGPAIIYGSDYGDLQESLEEMMAAWNILDRKEDLEVETTAGILRACRSTDPGQPGICVVLQPAGYDEEIDVSYVSVYEDPEYRTSDNERPVDVCIMTYADATSEDYTSKEIIRREDVIAGLGESENS